MQIKKYLNMISNPESGPRRPHDPQAAHWGSGYQFFLPWAKDSIWNEATKLTNTTRPIDPIRP